ncbi:amino acid adenylation domain-containing protein [Streptoalloteichus hindustanus]|uniref:Amino acid adenylation domain-containing protein/thioester reductase domain-containing protein n=1 Tax=Streptoalloteichus hindustanus TaxID=2017 RepID=A0A1M5HZR3_STRHI|nr:amino acid adenylation domain-containing protein [Streptoalloteichus hindustanus]SHG21437.1 amino acid adenylation domain-containing protein/thioester reductase domain-containing protein [Streptoalloteichus hindustanus]
MWPARMPPEWTGVSTDYPRDRLLHEVFDDQAAARPDALAAVRGAEALTYGRLRARSDALAARLAAAGVRPGEFVGICGTRSLPALVAILGILKAGAAYVPLDDTYPPARLRAMAEEVELGVAVVLPGSVCRVRRLRARVDYAAPHAAPRAAPPPRRPVTAISAADCAYVMFTSGSSGRPKPVAVPHRGVVRLAVSDRELQPPRPTDRVLHALSLSSDGSTHEIWSALLNGACLVLVEREVLLSPTALAQHLRAQEVTFAHLATSVFHHMARTTPEALARLRFVSAGGEAMDPELTRAVLRACPNTTVVNFYGPTENSVVSTAHLLRELGARAEAVPIGRPLANSTAHVVRADGAEAGPGEAGELLVGGDGLALGYLGDPELTAERFVPDPLRAGGRRYRTGDLVRRRADGLLEYLGRADRQIKLRGHRIELDEVEARLRAHPDVGEAVVEVSARFGVAESLTAHVTPAAPGRVIRVAELRRELAAWLPAQAVPARIVPLAAFPLTASGKVDRRRLAATRSGQSGQSGQSDQSGQTGPAPAVGAGLESTVAEIWRLTLRVRPDSHDSFFDLGGDSMLAAEVVLRTVAVLGIDAHAGSALVGALLAGPTLAEFTEAVRAARARAGDDETGTSANFHREAELGFALPPPAGPPPRWDAPAHVLLTGATGFVGAHLLTRLLEVTDAVVHCPVRARDAGHARRRVLATLARFGLRPTAAHRLVCHPGDITAPDLGLPDGVFAALAGTADLVIHSAAEVNFLYPYAALRQANVVGTRTVLRLAAARRVPVHFLSTIGVVAGYGTAGVRRVAEDAPLDHADRLTMGYAESKWVAERMVRHAGEQGLPVAVYRPYEVTGDRHRGICNTDTAICSLFRAFADMGVAPDSPLPLDFVPVDFVAAAVVHLATRREATRRVYHLTNPRPALLADMVGRMRAAGCAIDTRSYPEWVAELVRFVAREPTHPAAPFVSLCLDRAHRAEMSVKEMYFADTFPELGRDNVERDLAGSGLSCPPVDARLLDLYLAYFFDTGYLRRPGSADETTRGEALPRTS